MKTIAILQARMNSTRLPGKVLLPLGGYPLFGLSALRAGNKGCHVLVATSTESNDDPIAKTCEQFGIDYIRGPLDDVAARFELALHNYPDSQWVIRLTADNVFPDGDFLQRLHATAVQQNITYLGTYSPLDGLPYGLSAEIFTAGALRGSLSELTVAEREHVTPALRRKTGAPLFRPLLEQNLSHLRCTVDTPEDYHKIKTLFDTIPDPLNIPWIQLCNLLT